MALLTLEQNKKFIEIDKALEEFCETDPELCKLGVELSKLDSTRPDPECNPKDKFEEWYARYSPIQDAATERFVKLFREEILVAIVLRDGEEKVLQPKCWSIPEDALRLGKVEDGQVPALVIFEGADRSIVSEVEPAPQQGPAFLTVMKGKFQGLPLDDPMEHLENSPVVLEKEAWEKWKVVEASQREAALKKFRYGRWAERQRALVSSGQAKNLREAAQKIANEEAVDLIYVERETRRVRKKKAEKSGEKREEKISSLPPLNA